MDDFGRTLELMAVLALLAAGALGMIMLALQIWRWWI